MTYKEISYVSVQLHFAFAFAYDFYFIFVSVINVWQELRLYTLENDIF
jgi:hypothetical protein